ncbi:GIY-YIG nuclease family protein [Geobacillus sp. WSUCF-018B]|uniref:GIY-YIG nuclease family protein n=1 Tax=Geobacillus sp. WSUCF-018B TaxID=2055939 RepID=UPI000C2840F5|nr:GIY-YIG nuclease family protein [Geobacillus sp. WSUCF-018B]PJW18904.1 hypothetical protein CV944_01490 [Geobacillus sp. WSUCF-018B]
MMLKAVPGVYAIINRNNRKMYIGRSKNILARCEAHAWKLKTGNHGCDELQEDFDFGNQIDFVALLEMPGASNEELKEMEQHFIYIFQTYDREHGYNKNKRPTSASIAI